MFVQALELLVEKCAGTIDSSTKSASAILLRVFECIASGLLLDGTCDSRMILYPGR